MRLKWLTSQRLSKMSYFMALFFCVFADYEKLTPTLPHLWILFAIYFAICHHLERTP